MQIVYLIAGQGERDAIFAPLRAQSHDVECFDDAESFLTAPDIDPSGCILIDPRPDDAGALARLAAIREPLPIIVLTDCADVAFAVRAMKEGASDVVQKPIDPVQLRAAVSVALEKSRVRAEQARRKKELRAKFRSLSARERDVVDAVLEGRGNREVASQLGIKPRTVEIHRSNAMNKLGARTLPDLVRIWLDVDANTARLSAE